VAALCFAPLFYASACVSIPLTAPVVYRFIFFVCHFDWKIVRNWKFLPLAKSSIHTHIDTLIAERGQRCLCRRRCLGLDIMENQSVKKKEINNKFTRERVREGEMERKGEERAERALSLCIAIKKLQGQQQLFIWFFCLIFFKRV